MTSKLMITVDDKTRSEIEHICETLNLDKTSVSKGAVISHLIAQIKQSVEIRTQFEKVMDERAELKEKIEELEEQVEGLDEEILNHRNVFSAAKQLLIHLMGARVI